LAVDDRLSNSPTLLVSTGKKGGVLGADAPICAERRNVNRAPCAIDVLRQAQNRIGANRFAPIGANWRLELAQLFCFSAAG
jgi:hypothetical protein